MLAAASQSLAGCVVVRFEPLFEKLPLSAGPCSSKETRPILCREGRVFGRGRGRVASGQDGGLLSFAVVGAERGLQSTGPAVGSQASDIECLPGAVAGMSSLPSRSAGRGWVTMQGAVRSGG